jgi:hypothetical protein
MVSEMADVVSFVEMEQGEKHFDLTKVPNGVK